MTAGFMNTQRTLTRTLDDIHSAGSGYLNDGEEILYVVGESWPAGLVAWEYDDPKILPAPIVPTKMHSVSIHVSDAEAGAVELPTSLRSIQWMTLARRRRW